MTIPGIVTGQPISGRQAGNALFQLLPCFPHEGPPGMLRFMAQRLWPGGFLRPQPVVPAPPSPVIAPAVPAQPPIQPVAAASNRVVNTRAVAQPAQPNPAPAGFRPIREGGNPIGASSRRIRIVERKGM